MLIVRLILQSQSFSISSAGVLCKCWHAGGESNGGDCTVVTSQSYRGPDESFKGTVCLDFSVLAFKHLMYN